MEAVELYLSINGKEGNTFKRTARRNAEYVAKAIGNKPIASFSSSEAAQFRDWCLDQGMTISTVKRVFGSVRAIVNLVMREHGILHARGREQEACLHPSRDNQADTAVMHGA